MKQPVALMPQALKTPHAAAVAGIIFAVLFTISMVLMRITLPEDLSETNIAAWLRGNTATISLALTLAPFAGIAFLWFMGVVRDRLGTWEDQFFATIFFGSGLLFLALVFSAAAIEGGLLASYAIEADTLMKSGGLSLGSAFIYTIMKVYAIRMAAVFMLSLGSIWMRTHVMHRVYVFFTFAMALLLLVISNFTFWLILLFPVWVCVISVFILIATQHGEHAKAAGMIGSPDLGKDK